MYRKKVAGAVAGVAVMILASCMPRFSFCQEGQQGQDEKKSSLTVPWDEFKQLLKIGQNDVVLTWDNFQKLLAQTGAKQKPDYKFSGGNVILTQSEFKKLISQMVPPQGLTPPFDYLITSAEYKGKMKKESVTFSADFTIHVLKKNAFVKIPFLSNELAIEKVLVNNHSAIIAREGNQHFLTVADSGEYDVQASFSVKASLDKGPSRFRLPIPPTSITLFSLEIPLRNVEVEIPEAQYISTSSRDSLTIVSASIRTGDQINVKWSKQVPTLEKIPAKVYVEVYHLVSIEDDALKITTDINYNVLHSEIDTLRMIIPDNINILNIAGDGVGEWREKESKEGRQLILPLTYAKKGRFVISLTTEKTLSEKDGVNQFSGFHVLDTVREIGFLGVELNTSAEVNVVDSTNLEKIAVQKLPPALYNKSVKPLIFGFKYLKHPFSSTLDIKKHKKISVPMAAIDTANIVTLFTEDGKVVHRVIYQVRNSGKQFLQLGLPENAVIWSVFVGGEPAESSINAEGNLLIPLIRSRSLNQQLNTFPVEVIYNLSKKKFSITGMKYSELPKTDIIISQLMWSVYLPNDYVYYYFLTSLEKETMVRGVNLFGRRGRIFNKGIASSLYDEMQISKTGSSGVLKKTQRAYDGTVRSKFKNAMVDEEFEARQIQAEVGFEKRMEEMKVQTSAPQIAVSGEPAGAGVAGVLPIHIKIPTGGQVYRFAKTIVNKDDSLYLKVFYSRSIVPGAVKTIIVLFLIYLLYLKRGKIAKLVPLGKKWISSTKTFFEHNEKFVSMFIGSKMFIVVLFGMFIVFVFTSTFLAVVTFIVLALVIVYQVILYIISRFKKKEEKAEEKPEGQ